MNRYLKLLLFLTFALTIDVFANVKSMRKCMLLPITDGVGGAIGFKVHEYLERYLKNSNWCYYKSNAGVVGILSNFNTT